MKVEIGKTKIWSLKRYFRIKVWVPKIIIWKINVNFGGGKIWEKYVEKVKTRTRLIIISLGVREKEIKFCFEKIIG